MNTYKCLRALIIFLVIAGWIFSGWPRIWQNPPIPPEVKLVKASPDIEVKKPTAYTDVSVWTNPGQAYDFPSTANDQTTEGNDTSMADADPAITFHTWASKTQTYTATVLKVNWKTNGLHVDDQFAIRYTKNGGAGWTDLVSMGVHNETTIQTSSANLDANQDLTQVQVKVVADRVKGGDGGTLYIYDIWTEGTYTAPSITLTVDSPTKSLGNITPGTPVTATTIATVTTNNSTGYSLKISDSVVGSDSALLHTDTTTRIADYVAPISAPTTWTGTGLGICVYIATNKNTSQWGTGTTETDSNNKYAGIPETATEIHNVGSAVTNDNTYIGYKLNVPTSQKIGAYSGVITYTAVVN